MKLKIAATLILVFLASCGKYKMLKPKPEVLARESDYIRILDKDKYFQLESGKKYYMEFPAVQEENFYLVLKVAGQDALNSHLTRQFTKGKGDIKISDETDASDDLLVYKLDRTVQTFTWVIEDVSREMGLDMDYRYMPIWRFEFETRNAKFQTILARNKVERENYDNLGNGVRLSDIRLEDELSDLRRKNDNLKAIQGELLEIESIFPSSIRNSDDKAYLDYQGLKSELESELAFHEDYQATLNYFKQEKDTRSNNSNFLASLDTYNDFFANQNRYPENVVSEAKAVMRTRLAELSPYLANQIRQKRDVSPVAIPVDDLQKLYDESGAGNDSQFNSVARFTREFNQNAEALASARSGLSDLMKQIENSGDWPSDNFYSGLMPKLNRLSSSLPSTSGNSYGEFSNTEAVRKLNQQSRAVNQDVSTAQRNFQRAGQIVPQINRLRARGDFRGIVQLLNNNRQLDFLVKQYANLDQRSLDQQSGEIDNALENRQWALAEQRLRQLAEDRNFINYSAIASRKQRIQKDAENKLVSAIERASRERINAFIDANKNAFQNVEALYNDPAFTPVHVMSYSAGGALMVEQYNNKVQQYLDGFKYDSFPRNSIENLYKDFVRDTRAEGVAKGKAVAIHGKYYKGDNKKIKNLIAECDPLVPKWITKAKQYRKVYVLPVNDAQQASNEYVFKMNIQIPSDAQFPVFDVNIKLPREVANSAGSQKWYDRITMNGNVLKNEGRFTIAAPTRDNDYTCQITPVQMKKTGNNILEVRFKHDAFKVLEVSVMSQRPILKKN